MKTDIYIEHVTEFNRRMRELYPGQIQMIFRNTKNGDDLKHGYVLSIGKSHRLYRTQTAAQVALVTRR